MYVCGPKSEEVHGLETLEAEYHLWIEVCDT